MSIENVSFYRRRLALLAVAIMLVSGCATLQVGSDYDHAASFHGYKTFTIMQRGHSGISSSLVAVRVSDAIKADLEQKGFVEVADPSKADFTVDFTIGARERIDINSYPEPFPGRAWGWGRAGWWGGRYWGESLDVRQYREGILSIDIFDTPTHRPVWHGWAKKELTRKDMDNSAEPIRKAVVAVLAEFPPA